MPRCLVIAVLLLAACATKAAPPPELSRWEQRAAAVTIVRDDWGIAHVHGTTDADAVFGMIYAQAEDDFNRVETNYLVSLGRLAAAEGEGELYRDLRQRLFIDTTDLQAQYASSPAWLRALMDGWADGLNYFLHTHPAVKPRVLTRFEPWMALSFSEGSIGGDIERVDLGALQAFYGGSATVAARGGVAPRRLADPPVPPLPAYLEATGSNGIAIAPANTVHGHALLLITPHTSFFFRSELQVTSDEGLNAYGAVTWGQFFVYQGFNASAGWMHTSSGVDNIDEYLETVTVRGDSATYRYDGAERPLARREITVAFRTDTGLATRRFTTWRSHHGPIVRAEGDRWVAVRLMEAPRQALTQSFSRTKAANYAQFREVMGLHTNSSNNTLFADGEGNIAYFHANFIPRRDPRFDWNRPVDGSDPATEWGAPMALDSSPLVHNPPNGWVYNSNNWPYSAAGPGHSPRRADYPAYTDLGLENPRGIHAMQVLGTRRDFTVDALVTAAYDSYLPAFADLVPALLDAYDHLLPGDSLRRALAEPVAALRGWDYRWSAASVPTTLAVSWGDALWARSRQADLEDLSLYEFMARRTTRALRLEALAEAVDQLTRDFGTWRTPWGEVNRFQRLTDDIVHPFDDAGPSLPVPFTSSRWGSLASFGTVTPAGTKKRYGVSGNSFVAVVEFGDSVRARAVTAGGESGDPASPHFNDQAERYAAGNLREVYFYPDQLAGHTERSYRPGE
ncbi:MAG: penicillin acylase family protein [Gemmatimonadales bacterium]|nr:penicillin acylase family protein [Gemmatimonadales bacterium]